MFTRRSHIKILGSVWRVLCYYFLCEKNPRNLEKLKSTRAFFVNPEDTLKRFNNNKSAI